MNVIDATDLLISPGFIDLHVHLREPGFSEKETIATGTMAAAKGGFTTIAAMPNTKPVPDSVATLGDFKERISKKAAVRVLPIAAITKGQKGEELVDFQKLAHAGAFAFSDDGVGVENARLMYEAMQGARSVNKAIVAHCEDPDLTYGGSVHDGEVAKRMGIPGIPSVSEAVHIARDAVLAHATGCHYHVCHVSTKESVALIRQAKALGVHITAEVTPHHLLLCEDDIPGDDANFKMNPPLRSRADRDALLEGLLDGTIDFIATDHAPHTQDEKRAGMKKAPFGIVGLETAFPLLYTYLVEKGYATLQQLLEWLTVKPANCFGLPYGRLEVGKVADLVLLDLSHEHVIDPASFVSKGKNTPFAGWRCRGVVQRTLVAGKTVWKTGESHV